MALRDNRQKVINIHTLYQKAPNASDLNYGEIAVQNCADEAAIYTLKGENQVAKFIDETATQSRIDTAKTVAIAEANKKIEAFSVKFNKQGSETTETFNKTNNLVDLTLSSIDCGLY